MSDYPWHTSVFEPISGLYHDITPIHGKMLHSRSFELTSLSKCLQRSWFRSTNPKLMIDVDALSDRLSIAAFSSELHAKHRAVDTPKIKFSMNKS